MTRLLSIIIPVFNEAQTIGEVIRRTAAVDVSRSGFEKEIIICDDGSRDRTFDEIERARTDLSDLVRVVRHEENRGKGAAIRTALEHARGEYVLIQDADLEYQVSDYPQILAPLARGAQVVYGSRFLTRAYPLGMNLSNFAANKLLTAFANLLYGVGITDEATCFKIIQADLLRSLNLTCTGFEFCPEVTAKIGLRKIPIVEVPVSYQARSVLAGKKVGWRDGVTALRVLVSLRLGRGR